MDSDRSVGVVDRVEVLLASRSFRLSNGTFVAIVDTFYGSRRGGTECPGRVTEAKQWTSSPAGVCHGRLASGGEVVGKWVIRTDLHRKVDCHGE
jgi:hypothetical protein